MKTEPVHVDLTLEEVLSWGELTLEEFMENIPPEERFVGLTPEERLAGLKPEELQQLMQQIEDFLDEQPKLQVVPSATPLSQEKVEVLMLMLRNRFGDLSPKLVQQLEACTDLSQLLRWIDFAVKTKSLAEFESSLSDQGNKTVQSNKES